MISIMVALILFSARLSKQFPLENEETTIMLDLIKTLKIKHAIFLVDDAVRLNDFKTLSCIIPTTVKTVRELEEYIYESEVYVDTKTMIIYKSFDLVFINFLLGLLEVSNILHRLSYFTWLVFSLEWMSLPNTIPYDCQFILVYAYEDIYLLFEIYHLKTELDPQQHLRQYGKWDAHNGLILLETEPVYYRRTDMNQSLFVGYSQDFYFEMCSELKYRRYRNCNYVRIMREITQNLNFKYKTEILDSLEDERITTNFLQLHMDMREHWYNLYEIQNFTTILKYFPRNKLRWFIKYPEKKQLNDFYVRPFHKYFWYTIYITVVICGIVTVIIQYIHTHVLKIDEKFDFGSLMFSACDAFMNQGTEVTDQLSFRIAFLIIRLTVLIIFPAYCADLTALLYTGTVDLDFHNIKEFLKNGNYKMLLPDVDELYITTYFENYAGAEGKEVVERFSEFYSDDEQAQQLLCSDRKYALPLYVYPNIFGHTCRIYKMKKPLADDHHFTFVLGYEGYPSPYAKILNHKLLKVVEGGIVKKIESLDSSDEYLETQENIFHPIDLYQLEQVLIFVLFFCTVVPVAILTLESILSFIRGKITENKSTPVLEGDTELQMERKPLHRRRPHVIKMNNGVMAFRGHHEIKLKRF